MQELIIHSSVIIPLAYGYKKIIENNDNYLIFFYTCLLLISFLAYLSTIVIIPVMKAFCLKADLFGKDINKKGTP